MNLRTNKPTIQEIEAMANEELKKIFEPLQSVYMDLYNYIEENGKVYLEDSNLEIIEENGIETVWIEDQSLNYFLQKEGDTFRLFVQRQEPQNQPKREIRSVYHFSELRHFYIVFESIMLEIEKGEFFKKDSDMMFYRLQETIGNQFELIFRSEEKELLTLYPKLKEAGTSSAYTTRLAVFRKKDSVEVDELMDSIAKKFNFNFTMTDEEKEESRMRDALVLKRSDDAFVLVVKKNTNNEYENALTFELCYTKEKDENFPSLDFLMNDYNHYKCRPIYKYQYSIRIRRPLKGGTAKMTEVHHFSDSNSSLFYFVQLKEFFEEWEKAKTSYYQNEV